MKTRQQILDRIMKVKALADRGTDGERTAAKRLLDELMEKYHIDEDNIDTDKKDHYFIDTGDSLFSKLFFQLYLSKFGTNRSVWSIDKMPKKEKQFMANMGFGDKNANHAIECTKAEFLEVKMLFEIYKNDLNKQLDTFMYAYYSKNDLLVPANQDKELTKEEEEKAFKAMLMAAGIDKKEIYKMIE